MKLLDKKTINKDQQDLRRSQIEEGTLLARKIDVLRETLSSLEKQHADFLVSSQKQTQEVMTQLESNLEPLRQEIRALESKRVALMKPLDEEWEKLDVAKEKHEENVRSFVARETSLQELEDSLYQRERGLSMSESRLKDGEIELEQRQSDLEDKRISVEKLAVTTTEAHRIFIEERDETNHKLEAKTEEYNGWARSLDQRKKALDVREDNLNKREKLLADRQALLDRTIIRTSK